MTTDRTTTKLVELASSLTLDDLPDVARTAAKARILSTIAAFDMEPVRIARRLVQPVAAKRLRELEAENAKLKKLLAEAHLDVEALKVAFGVKR
jgi:hypothetical protein